MVLLKTSSNQWDRIVPSPQHLQIYENLMFDRVDHWGKHRQLNKMLLEPVFYIGKNLN
jgi:hypothetical protein